MEFLVDADIQFQIIAAVFAVVVLGAFIQATLGLGFGPVVAPILFLISPDLVPALVIMLGMSSAIGGIIGQMEKVDFGEVGIALVGRLFGVVGAGYVLSLVDNTREFAIVFATALLVTIAISLANIRFALTPRNITIGGFLSGLLGTVTAVGSVPMALLYQHEDPAKARTTMNTFFAVGVLMSLAALWYAGFFGLKHVIYAVFLMPGVVIGAMISRRVTGYTDKRYRRLVLWFAAIASSVILLQALLSIE